MKYLLPCLLLLFATACKPPQFLRSSQPAGGGSASPAQPKSAKSADSRIRANSDSAGGGGGQETTANTTIGSSTGGTDQGGPGSPTDPGPVVCSGSIETRSCCVNKIWNETAKTCREPASDEECQNQEGGSSCLEVSTMANNEKRCTRKMDPRCIAQSAEERQQACEESDGTWENSNCTCPAGSGELDSATNRCVVTCSAGKEYRSGKTPACQSVDGETDDVRCTSNLQRQKRSCQKWEDGDLKDDTCSSWLNITDPAPPHEECCVSQVLDDNGTCRDCRSDRECQAGGNTCLRCNDSKRCVRQDNAVCRCQDKDNRKNSCENTTGSWNDSNCTCTCPEGKDLAPQSGECIASESNCVRQCQSCINSQNQTRDAGWSIPWGDSRLTEDQKQNRVLISQTCKDGQINWANAPNGGVCGFTEGGTTGGTKRYPNVFFRKPGQQGTGAGCHGYCARKESNAIEPAKCVSELSRDDKIKYDDCRTDCVACRNKAKEGCNFGTVAFDNLNEEQKQCRIRVARVCRDGHINSQQKAGTCENGVFYRAMGAGCIGYCQRKVFDKVENAFQMCAEQLSGVQRNTYNDCFNQCKKCTDDHRLGQGDFVSAPACTWTRDDIAGIFSDSNSCRIRNGLACRNGHRNGVVHINTDDENKIGTCQDIGGEKIFYRASGAGCMGYCIEKLNGGLELPSSCESSPPPATTPAPSLPSTT